MKTIAAILLASLVSSACFAAEPAPAAAPIPTAAPSVATPSDYVLMHFILRQDQSRNLAEIQQVMRENKFWAEFPPEGIPVESWYVVIGLGQVVTLRVPPARLREVNLALERTAWKIFRTEAYAAYDLKKVAESFREKARMEAAAAPAR
jgi:hypothetical protein